MYMGNKSPQYKIPDAVRHFQGFPRFIHGRLYELGIANARICSIKWGNVAEVSIPRGHNALWKPRLH